MKERPLSIRALRIAEPKTVERRRHNRVAVSLSGRFMLENRQEYPCRTVDMSPGGVLLASPVKGRLLENVVAYLDHIGRVEGTIVRHTAEGFAIKLSLAAAKRDRVADLLTWLANRETIGAEEDRRHQRIVPHRLETQLQLPMGRVVPATIIDISVSGVGVIVGARPALGTRVVVGATAGKIVRHLPEGVAIEFLRLIPAETFDEDIIL